MSGPPTHLQDGALVRILDGQPLADDDRAHLSTCGRCQARRRDLEAKGERLAGLLAGARIAEPSPPPDLWERVRAASAGSEGPHAPDAGADDLARRREPRNARRRRPWSSGPVARAAAVVGILLAGALAAEPVRERILEGIGRAMAALGGDGSSAPNASIAEGPGSTVVSFVPRGEIVEIQLDEGQPDGTIQVVFEDRPDAAGEVLSPEPEASLLILPDGFRVRNAGGRAWSYRFRLPASLARVPVRVGGDVVRELTPADDSVVLQVPPALPR